MDFGFSEEQEQLRSTVRDFLARQAPPGYARAVAEDGGKSGDEVWDAMAALGWQGLTVPERFGGSGLGILELVIVLEAMGEVVLPGSFASTLGLGLPALLAAGSEEQLARWLPGIADGSIKVTAAIAEAAGRWDVDGISSSALRDGTGYVLDGEKLFVPEAAAADLLVVVCRLDAGLAFFAVESGCEGLGVQEMSTVDRSRRLHVVEFSHLRLDASALLGAGVADARVLGGVIDVAKTALSAEMCGCAAAALELSVEYAKIREQFGRAIGSFQAIQHRCADMKVDLENARSLAYHAGWALDDTAADGALAAATAKAYASDACTRVVADAIQVHGGIGFTWEHDLHLYFKRVKADEATYGDADFNRDLVAGALGI